MPSKSSTPRKRRSPAKLNMPPSIVEQIQQRLVRDAAGQLTFTFEGGAIVATLPAQSLRFEQTNITRTPPAKPSAETAPPDGGHPDDYAGGHDGRE